MAELNLLSGIVRRLPFNSSGNAGSTSLIQPFRLAPQESLAQLAKLVEPDIPG